MEQLIYFLIALIIGLMTGSMTVWLVMRTLNLSAVDRAQRDGQINTARLNEQLLASQNMVLAQAERLETLQDEQIKLTMLHETLVKERERLNTTLELERSQTKEKLTFLENAEEQLSNRFKTLASEILEEKSKKFTDQNKTNLNQLLEPLKIKITEFQGQVNEVYIQEGKDRSALSEQVKQLMALNNQLSEDAHNLTLALKGQAKVQGNWGELILERILEASGLRKGHEYEVQESHSREDGSRVQPDVVIHLPENRHLIIDAKVSLTAYEVYAKTENDSESDAATKRHLESIRSHIKGLSEKNYQQLYGVESLDFVLMFIPIEPAFMLAIAHDENLWLDSWNRNILLVSPSTLLFVVRTVAHLWRQEQQNHNAQEIARRGAELYDKLAGFVEDLDMLGKRLRQAQETYDGAYNKFTSGKGNVIRQAEMLKQLGVEPDRKLPQSLLDRSSEEIIPIIPFIIKD